MRPQKRFVGKENGKIGGRYVKLKKVTVLLVLIAAIFMAGCVTPPTPTPTPTSTPTATPTPTPTVTNHLIITVYKDDAPAPDYNYGDQADVQFSGSRFTLTDKFEDSPFHGTWSLKDNSLTLDFDEYPTWRLTLSPTGVRTGTFTGTEAGYANSGVYNWV